MGKIRFVRGVFFSLSWVASESLKYQYPVKMEDGDTKWADCFWEDMTLVEMKLMGHTIIEEFTVKGYVMDDDWLKNFGTILTKDYFEEQL